MLTRENIRSGRVRKLLAADPLTPTMIGEGAVEASRRRILRRLAPGAPLWIFGYGSLIWNPAFHYTARVPARLDGFQRRFCLWTTVGRGAPDRPSLVLGLDVGGTCHDPQIGRAHV